MDGLRLRLAKLTTEVFSPAAVVLVLPLAVAWKATGRHLGETVLWGVVVALFSSVLPMLFIIRGARQGRWDGHHVRDREHRFVPLAVGLASTAVGLAILLIGGAPRDVVGLIVAMVTTLAACIAVTTWWKVSLHAAVAAGAVVMIALLYGPWALLLLMPVALVCWSRVVLGDHTVAQVVVGAAMGPLVGGAVLLLIR
ncbi:hypothetical protein [Alloactinosynnema sp. L-07]|uniref:hypothetical protein n=1 Tax=Alloactinosynnema sp. L-07 TaxID=1653480 RepID=UPI00065EF1C0|nr:hypothetical protein [Alloactinosynnema sp. L-07]CRK56404.1 hypothetical protein [Alloactinosynnema sp. L-07]